MAFGEHRLQFLHISDLHAQGPREKEHWRRRRVLGDAWQRNLETILAEEGPVHFVFFTGDAADRGKPAECDEATGFFHALLTELHLEPDRLFVVPGNHDVTTSCMSKVWRERYGRRYYHFVYRDVLFLVLNTDDPPGAPGGIGPDQIADVRKALDENRGVRWTVVFLHRPLWDEPGGDKTGWPEVEKALADRPYTVFAGHVHSFRKYVRQGRDFYQLATTGGGSGPYSSENKPRVRVLILLGAVYILALVAVLTALTLWGEPWQLVPVPAGMWVVVTAFYALVPRHFYRSPRLKPDVSIRWISVGRLTYITLLFTGLAWLCRLTAEPWGLYYLVLWCLPLGSF